MNKVPAWLMQVDRISKVAVGQMELIHIIASPEYVDIPKTPEYCSRIVIWNNRVLPVIDLSSLVTGVSAYYQHNSVAVAMYVDSVTSQYKYGGIQLTDTPVMDHVSDDQFVDAAKLTQAWKAVSISAYRGGEGEVIPILNVEALFSPGINAKLPKAS